MVLEGKVALVTGGGRGLGRAYALRLAGLGADDGILDLDLHSYREFEMEQALLTADTTVDEVLAIGRRSCGVEVDLTSADASREAVASVVGEMGRLDVVVCNAGGGLGSSASGHASSMDPAQFDAVIKRNLYATVHTCMAVAPVMKEQGSGKIITITSTAGLRPTSSGAYAHYGMAKAAIVMYTRYLASELGASGITVNCVAPGFVPTGRIATKRIVEGRGFDDVAAHAALGRIGTTSDLAAVVGFLAGPDSDYMTGVILPVDGGSSL
jgi:3-oxoacyl-[acyl-carrier protein] reductase